ncbi:MAG: hypothetical protein JWP30_1321 [Homoserinimonas sp.]|jgi:hypothetical protein|nr:hypothetical protein [Homoserinimonas sp.]
MKRTQATTLLIVAVIGVVAGALLQAGLAASGRPGITPPVTLGIVLAVLGVVLVVLAWPIRKVIKGTATSRVDPFYATRVVVLAKASAISGALLAGVALGLIAYLLTRSVLTVEPIGYSVATLAGAVILVVGALIAEFWCRIPPEDDSDTGKDPVQAVP